MANYLYIIDPKNYNGLIINTCRTEVPFYVDYMDKPTTLEDYKQMLGNDNLIALDWDTYYEEYYSMYLQSLQKPFVEITKEDWWDALECLPPMRWTRFDGGEYFFISEATTASLHSCYVRKGDRYYTALRDIYAEEKDLITIKK